MLRPRISPILLLTGSGCVKTKTFNYYKYLGDIINSVRIFNELNVDELVVFDFDFHRNSDGKKVINFDLLLKVAREAEMPLCYGGGITNIDQAKRLIQIGFEKISLCSAAFDTKLLSKIIKEIGAQSLVLHFDYKTNIFGSRKFFTEAGTLKEKSSLYDIIEFVNKVKPGEVCFQSISNEGLKTGFDLDLVNKTKELLVCPVRFSGGCGSVDDIVAAFNINPFASYSCSSIFVLKGRYDAVLLNYEKPNGWC